MQRLWIFMLLLLVVLPNVHSVPDEMLDVFMNEVKKLREIFDEFKVNYHIRVSVCHRGRQGNMTLQIKFCFTVEFMNFMLVPVALSFNKESYLIV